MASIQKSVATLRIFGDDLVPREVTQLLGCEPSKAARKGEVFVTSSGERTSKHGNWRLSAPPCEPENIDHQVSWLLNKLTSDLEVWKQLGEKFEVDLFCGLFMGSGNDGFSISPGTMEKLASRGIAIGFDIYDSTQ